MHRKSEMYGLSNKRHDKKKRASNGESEANSEAKSEAKSEKEN